MEPATFRDLYDRYLNRKDKALLKVAVDQFVWPGIPAVDQLESNDLFAAAMARIRYITAKREAFRMQMMLPRWGNTGRIGIIEAERIRSSNSHKNTWLQDWGNKRSSGDRSIQKDQV